MWEGESPIDLLKEYAPWAIDELCTRPCECDGVACATQARTSGPPEFHPISAAHPLRTARHFVAAQQIHMDLGVGVGALQEFYNPLGVTLLGTVTDNDCGLDTMCMMLPGVQTFERRLEIRARLSDYVLRRMQTSRLRDLMVATCELNKEEVDLARGILPNHSGAHSSEPVVIEDGAASALADAGSAPTDAGSALAGCSPDPPISAPAGPEMSGEHGPSAEMSTAAGHASEAARRELYKRAIFWEDDLNSDLEAADGRADDQPAPAGQPADPPPAPQHVAPVALACVPSHPKEVIRKALLWGTGTKDAAIIGALENSLDEWVIAELVQKYTDAQLIVVDKTPKVIKINLRNRQCKLRVGAAFGQHLTSHGIPAPQATRKGPAPAGKQCLTYFKMPETVWASFMSALEWPKRLPKCFNDAYKRKLVKRWHESSLDAAPVNKGGRGKKTKDRKKQIDGGLMGVHLIKAPSIRKRLYDWFLSMRYSIDWDALNKRARTSGRRKAMGRFPRAILRTKVQQFQLEYAEECLTRGVQVRLFQPTSVWFKQWEQEYGLCMKQPNRKYKCSKELLARRLEAFWITVFRIRAFVMALFGYDPDMENFDQTPYHRNESGSQDARTLAVSGELVPLVECHGDTRVRWTANLTTFRDPKRIEDGERPYCEFMFKHDIKGDVSKLELRLREHIRARGYGPWVTVATSASGSYSQDDVLNFLDVHLPHVGPHSRAQYWRIMFCDDFAAHKTDPIRRLCWQRGYILILQPGGATPITQTCDTDLNQHVRREYIALETREFIELFQQGVAIPALREETMIDLMVQVLSGPEVHLRAAQGYKRTALAVDIDGAEDDAWISREAGKFWAELGMRKKVNEEIEMVRTEVRAGRLHWSYDAVVNLMIPYPKSMDEDRLLKLCHDAGYDEAEEGRWIDAGGDPEAASDDSSDESDGAEGGHADASGGAEDVAREAGAAAVEPASAGLGPHPRTAQPEVDAAVGPHPRTAQPEVDAAVATAFEDSYFQMSTLQAVHSELQSQGLLKEAHGIASELHKHRRRLSALSREDSGVAFALQDRRKRADEEIQLVRRRAEQAHEMAQTSKRIKAEVHAAEQELKRKRAALKEYEDALEVKHAMKTFTPELLGQGKKQGGGAKERKARMDCLDRLACFGVGLSPEQRNDWQWFKQAWDARMATEHDAEWGGTFASWIQHVLHEMTQDGGSNAFSQFVHDETLRCLSGQLALRLPGCP